ncbi:uncharacterized protein LOC128557554 isoform X2 [Mercenaria mercenaria]|nr:uncharacterized protein LOC128557554 isoform X2 [Mercenaria mercenaria]
MIDSLGGAEKVNNLLAVLNLKAIHPKNLKLMETRAGEAIQEVSRESCKNAAKEAFEKEMSDIARQETEQAHEQMVGEIDDLGVCPLPGESPSLQLRLQARPVIECETDSDVEKDSVQSEVNDPVPGPQNESSVMTSTPQNVLQSLLHTERISRLSAIRFAKQSPKLKSRKRLEKKFPCRTRTGMSSSCDTAWQKKGFDSLTSHTFFMTTNKAGRRKKVIKTIVGHRHCGKCKWWKRNRQGQKVRTHYCVKNHTGSARSMEAASGLKGVRELFSEGTPIEYLEGDGDNTLIARLKSDLNISLKKRFDKNHVVKNVTGTLYKMKSALKLSDNVISHIKKCLSYAFSKNQGDKIGMVENIRALIPHQFADHTLCHGRFCGYKRRPSEKYVHRSLPYMTPLHDSNLRTKLQAVFDTVAANAHSYVDLGSSQQCESANRRVSLRAPKSHYYGDTKSLDYRVEATAACINEGRHYLSQFSQLHGHSHTQSHKKRTQT